MPQQFIKTENSVPFLQRESHNFIFKKTQLQSNETISGYMSVFQLLKYVYIQLLRNSSDDWSRGKCNLTNLTNSYVSFSPPVSQDTD